MRVADYIPQFLIKHGVRDVFMLSGGGIMHLTDGLVCNKKIRPVCLHHEQAVSMAVEAYSRDGGNFGVGYLTTGPGATNAITGCAGAWLDSAPCLFISGQVKRRETVYKARIAGLRQFGVQEINILPMVSSITKYSAMVDDPRDIKFHLEKAFYAAHAGRPGPVWLDIPLDIQGAEIKPDRLKGFRAPRHHKRISRASMKTIVSRIKKARRPLFLVGQGVRIAGAINELLACSERYAIPIVTTYLGIDVVDSKHPCYVGRIGIKGDRPGNYALQSADLVIIMGTSLPVAEIGYDYRTFARRAFKIVVDVDISSHRKKTIRADRILKQDALKFLRHIGIRGPRTQTCDTPWLRHCRLWRSRYPVCLPEYAKRRSRVNIYYFIDRLSSALNKNDVVVTDAGSAFYAGSQGIQIKQGMRYITSGGFATMGYGLPASIGISAGRGGKRVVCVTGDGSFQQNIQELQTVVHYRLPVKMFVLNNEGYLSIRFTQARYFKKRFIGEGAQSGVSFPDLARIAHAYRIPYIQVRSNRTLDRALRRALVLKGPVICEILCPSDQLIIPTVASEKKADGSMVSKPLEDMFPFLPRKEFEEILTCPDGSRQRSALSRRSV